jgi:hypothetical protein
MALKSSGISVDAIVKAMKLTPDEIASLESPRSRKVGAASKPSMR